MKTENATGLLLSMADKKWPRSVPLQSHVNHIDFTHLSIAALQSQEHKLPFPAALQL